MTHHLDFLTLVYIFDHIWAGITLTGLNQLLPFGIKLHSVMLNCSLRSISSAHLCPWVLSLLAASAKCLHWCALNKTLRCHFARDSQKIYLTFMTFTFRKRYKAGELSGCRGCSAHLCNDMGWIPVIGKLYKNLNAPFLVSVKLWQKWQLWYRLFSLEICHRWLSSCVQPRK